MQQTKICVSHIGHENVFIVCVCLDPNERFLQVVICVIGNRTQIFFDMSMTWVGCVNKQ